MLELEKEVKEAGITVMNEIGLGKEPLNAPAQSTRLIVNSQTLALIMFVISFPSELCRFLTNDFWQLYAVKLIDEVHREGGKITR